MLPEDASDPDRPHGGTAMSAAASALGGWEGVAFDQLRIGAVVAAREFSIDREEVRRFKACLGEDPGGEDPAWVPVFLLNEFKTAKGGMRFPPGVMHASEALDIQRGVMTGDRLRVCVRVKDRFVRNGKRFVVMEQDICTPGTHDPALRIMRTLLWPC